MKKVIKSTSHRILLVKLIDIFIILYDDTFEQVFIWQHLTNAFSTCNARVECTTTNASVQLQHLLLCLISLLTTHITVDCWIINSLILKHKISYMRNSSLHTRHKKYH